MEQDDPDTKKGIGDQSQTNLRNEMAGRKHSDAKKLNEMFWEEREQLQYKKPKREGLVSVQGQVKRSNDDEWVLTRGAITLDKVAMELVVGAPVCALAAKRILLGLGWLSDDAVMAVATSASVAYQYFKSSRRSSSYL